MCVVFNTTLGFCHSSRSVPILIKFPYQNIIFIRLDTSIQRFFTLNLDYWPWCFKSDLALVICVLGWPEANNPIQFVLNHFLLYSMCHFFDFTRNGLDLLAYNITVQTKPSECIAYTNLRHVLVKGGSFSRTTRVTASKTRNLFC